jgi:hypothetical protein
LVKEKSIKVNRYISGEEDGEVFEDKDDVQEALDKAEEVIEELVKEKEKLLNKLTSLERQLAEQDQSMLGEVCKIVYIYICMHFIVKSTPTFFFFFLTLRLFCFCCLFFLQTKSSHPKPAV